MVNIDQDSLEKALNSNKVETPKENPPQQKQPQIPKEEEIGFHKGSLNTLSSERNELYKMIQNVEAIMQAHIKRLEELGVKIQTQQPQN